MDPKKRINVKDALTHQWFMMEYIEDDKPLEKLKEFSNHINLRDIKKEFSGKLHHNSNERKNNVYLK